MYTTRKISNQEAQRLGMHSGDPELASWGWAIIDGNGTVIDWMAERWMALQEAKALNENDMERD